MPSPLPTHSTGRLVRLLGFSLIALVALFVLAGRAMAAETLYWDNYNTSSISYANIDGGGGGALNLAGISLEHPEGMAIDSATGRLLVANIRGSDGRGQIDYVNLDGSGAGVLPTAGAPVSQPHGLAVDPVNDTAYWINSEPTSSISWAKLDGSAGGTLNTQGATLQSADRLAVDPAGGRIYWGNGEGEPPISYANLNGSGGGDLNIEGTTSTKDINAIAVDPLVGLVYWVDDELAISYAALNGSGGGALSIPGAEFYEAYGLSLDPTSGRFYWGNYENGSDAETAIGYADRSGTGGSLHIVTAPVDGAQDPIVLKGPSGTGAPQVSKSAQDPAALSCSTGSWAADYVGSSTYQAPHTYSYQWSLNGTAISGAISNSYTATAAGAYACSVTAANQAGSASQASAALSLSGAKLKLSTAKKAKARPGKAATFKVTALNQGDLPSAKAKLCVKVPKKAKRSVKAPKCKPLAAIAGGAKGKATVKLKVARKAKPGAYKVSILAKGVPANTVKAKLVVTKQR